MTEKDYNPQQKEIQAIKKQGKIDKVQAPKVVKPVKKQEKEIANANTNPRSDLHKENKIIEGIKPILEGRTEKPEHTLEEQNIPEEKDEKKEIVKTVPKIKRTEASVNALSLHISTKDAVAICKFIYKKKISQAIKDLEQVLRKEKAIPMKGEIPHRKGKGMSSGRFATKAVGQFIILLKTLAANANVNELDNPKIVEAMANMASRPYGRFGRMKKKRTHVKIIARDKIQKKKIAEVKEKKVKGEKK